LSGRQGDDLRQNVLGKFFSWMALVLDVFSWELAIKKIKAFASPPYFYRIAEISKLFN
jgi:hypothetical protein